MSDMSRHGEPSRAQAVARRQIVRPARKENLRVLRDFVEEACREAAVPERAVGQLKWAVDEVCTNLVAYGYKGGKVGDIRVTVEPEATEVRVTITDWGSPFHPDQAPAPDLTSDWRERRVGGLGWHLVRQVMDEIDYTAHPESGNVLTLIKKIERAAS